MPSVGRPVLQASAVEFPSIIHRTVCRTTRDPKSPLACLLWSTLLTPPPKTKNNQHPAAVAHRTTYPQGRFQGSRLKQRLSCGPQSTYYCQSANNSSVGGKTKRVHEEPSSNPLPVVSPSLTTISCPPATHRQGLPTLLTYLYRSSHSLISQSRGVKTFFPKLDNCCKIIAPFFTNVRVLGCGGNLPLSTSLDPASPPGVRP